MANVILFGCGRGADTAYRYFSRDSDHEICGFAVDREYRDRDSFHDLPVVDFETIGEHFPPSHFAMHVLMGFQRMNQNRIDKYHRAKNLGYTLVNYVSSNNHFVEAPSLGDNCFILGNQSVNLDLRIGNNVVLWTGNQLGDRSVIEDHVWVSSHVALSGDVRVGEASFLGVNSAVSNHVEIGPRNFIGANALITSSTGPDEVYVAEPTPRAPLKSSRFCRMVSID